MFAVVACNEETRIANRGSDEVLALTPHGAVPYPRTRVFKRGGCVALEGSVSLLGTAIERRARAVLTA